MGTIAVPSSEASILAAPYQTSRLDPDFQALERVSEADDALSP